MPVVCSYNVERQIDKRVCAWCNAVIKQGSICDDCMKKYNIKAYNSREDGYGCDTK